MKKSVRYILFSLCAVLLVTCGVLFALHKPSDNTPNNPGILTPEDEDKQPEDPTPQQPSINTFTINLMFPDGSVVQHTYDPSRQKFEPTAQEEWMETKERAGELYRFDNWYMEDTYHTKALSKNMKDGITVYAHMIEQVIVTVHGTSLATPEQTVSIRADKNNTFDITKQGLTGKAQLMGLYSDSNRTEEKETSFLVRESTEVYASWSSPYADFKVESSTNNGKNEFFLKKYIGKASTVVIPSRYSQNGKSGTVVGILGGTFQNGSSVTELTLPNMDMSLNQGCFTGLTSLQTITYRPED